DAYMAALRIGHQVTGRQCAAACLEGLADVALARGDPERTAWLLGAAANVLGELPSTPRPPRLAAQREQVARDVQQLLGQAAWAAAYAAGQALSPEEAFATVVETAQERLP